MLITEPEPWRPHRHADRLAESEHGLEVHAQDGAEGLERRLALGPTRRGPGVVDADVDPAEALERASDERAADRSPP